MKNLKNILTASALLIVMAMTISFTSEKNGKVIMLVTLESKNYSEWKKNFDLGAEAREKAGIKVISIGTSVEDPNKILVIEEATSLQAANEFMAMLKSKQKEGSVPPLEVKIYDKSE
jgi:hypothetical protein